MRRTLLRCWAASSSGVGCSRKGANNKKADKTQVIGHSYVDHLYNSAFTALTSVVVLVFHLAAGARLQNHERGADIVLVDFENHGLLMILFVGVADRQEVRTLLGEQEKRRNDHRHDIAAVHFFAVFDQVDLFVWDAPARLA